MSMEDLISGIGDNLLTRQSNSLQCCILDS